MKGVNEIDQYIQICNLIGKPRDKSQWKDFFKLENAEYILELSSQKYSNLSEKFRNYSDEVIDLLDGML